MIPEQIKTGFCPAQEEPPTAEQVANVKIRLLGLVCLLIKKAAVTAGVYTSHQGRHTVDGPEIVMALKYECLTFFENESLDRDLDAMLHQIAQFDDQDTVENFIASSPDDIRSGKHDGGPIVENVLNVVEDELQTHLPAPEPTGDADIPCVCALCEKMENIHFMWDAWEPTDEAQRFLKDHLANIIQVSG